MKLLDIVTIAKKYNKVHLIGHTNPDGDCIGATLGLSMLLEKCHIPNRVLLLEPSTSYSYLPISTLVDQEVPEEVELLIALDCGDVTRLGPFSELLNKATEVINIDHHISNTEFGDINFVDGEASSTCEMIYFMVEDKDLFDKAIAEALYTGIVYDTGVFKHSNTKPSTHHAAAGLIEYAIDYTWIINKMYFEKPLKTMKAQGLAYAHLMTFEDEHIVVSYLTLEDFKRLDITKENTSSIVQYMNEISGMSVAIFIYQIEEEVFKISLRSKGDVDVCKVAQTFGGGGHIKASGASFEGTLEDAIESIVEAVALQL